MVDWLIAVDAAAPLRALVHRQQPIDPCFTGRCGGSNGKPPLRRTRGSSGVGERGAVEGGRVVTIGTVALRIRQFASRHTFTVSVSPG
jgi:hypothetical protein